MRSSKKNKPRFPAAIVTFEGGVAMSIRHPCFDPNHAATATRIHLPIAKSCNIQCRFCNRLYDCVNESRPGVTSAILAPRQALAYLEKMTDVIGNIDVVGIAGPGDAFADPEITMETLHLVHNRFPSTALCISTNGLLIDDYAAQLANVGVTHATVTVNASDTSVGAAILAWVRFNKKTFRGREAASLLMERQLSAVTKLHDAGIVVKINTIAIPTVNESDIDAIARRTAMAGANVHNCIPFIPVSGSEFENLKPPDHDSMQKARWSASSHLPQVRHCNRCRADAAGILGKDDPNTGNLLRQFASMPLDPSQDRPFVAVASREGALVNEHVGKAERFFIYRREGGGIEFVETRPAPPSGGLLERWRTMARVLCDCRALLASQIGGPPQAVLEEEGIAVAITEGLITDAVSAVFEGRQVPRPVNLQPCSGPSNGHGCG
jgi:nitrogen fixation protein NifB